MLYYPIDVGKVSEWPGDRGGGNTHYGTDFAVPTNTPLKACFDGVVVFAGGDGAVGELYPGSGIWANGQGLTVDIQRPDGLIARYGHMNRIDVTVGQTVNAGHVLGLSGNTGFTTGPHCHWELRWDRLWAGGAWADPRDLGATALPQPSTTQSATKRQRKVKSMIRYYAHAQGKGKPGWLVMGVTPNVLLLSTESAAKEAAADLGVKIITENKEGFKKFLRAAGGSTVQIAKVA